MAVCTKREIQCVSLEKVGFANPQTPHVATPRSELTLPCALGPLCSRHMAALSCLSSCLGCVLVTVVSLASSRG